MQASKFLIISVVEAKAPRAIQVMRLPPVLSKQIILTSSLAHVCTPVEAAEGVVEAVHVRLAHTPAVRHPACDTRTLIGQGSVTTRPLIG